MSESYDRSVFLNVPFDSAYRPLFEAVTFAVYACGFLPRCALETEDGSQVRIDRINGIIRQCRLAIHDISRTQLDRESGLPRFNMPFELGLFFDAKAFGSRDHRRKACLVFDTERYRYQKFLSDIAGQDIRAHGWKVERVIHQVRDFLATQCPPHVILPGGRALADRYGTFRRGLGTSCAKLHLDPRALTFRDLTVLVVTFTAMYPASHLPHSGASPA